MGCSTCGRPSSFGSISVAIAKAAAARLRGTGALSTAADWAERAATCERCPLLVVRGGVSYCGTPFLRQVHRDPAVDGCGCPTRDKAKSPAEHCPVTDRHLPAGTASGHCSCKWCGLARARTAPPTAAA